MASKELAHIYFFNEKHGQGSEKLYAQWKEILHGGHDPNEEWDYKHNQIRTSPLFSAVLDNNLELAKLLLQYGAKIEKHNLEGRTALHEAIVRSHEDMVQLFLNHGADLETPVTSRHLEGGTALHLAATEVLVDVIEGLLQRGANPQARSRAGWTALDIAILDRQETVLAALLKYVEGPTIMSEISGLDEMSEDPADRDDPSVIACHLIEHGVRGAESKHRNLYLRCLARVTRMQAFSAEGSAELAYVLIHETDDMLMEIAGSPGAITWSRNLCSQCEQFQSQDGHNMFKAFEHSSDFAFLWRSAQNGCSFCHFIIESLNHHWCLLPQISKKWREEFEINPAVRLRVGHKNGMNILGDYQMIIVCGEKIAFIDLDHVQKHLNSAVAETGPSDMEGTGSDRSLAIAKAWLQRCIEEHPSCRLVTRGGLPTRVIDVGDESTPPYIYVSKREQESYVTLSYCWGNERNFCSLTENIDARTRGISLADLPKTMADAVVITRKLGVQYLWIDALCILQDSEEDLLHEIAYMGDIYTNSLLTIAAKVSGSCHDGCFRKRSWTTSALFPLDLRLPAGTREKDSRIHGRSKNTRTSNINRLMALPRHSKWPEDKETPILETRGWALQEDCLSRRMLNCGKDELSWTCMESTCSERVPEEDDSRMGNVWQLAVKRILGTGFSGYGNLNHVNAEKLFDYWLDLVSDFSRRKLSKPTDKLAALAGVQGAIGKLLEETPVAGMWQNRFFSPSLLWQVTTNGTNENGAACQCPSWSWASVTQPVTYIKPQSGKVNDWTWYTNTIYFPEVLSWNINASSQLGGIGGHVTLRCKLLRDNELSSTTKESIHFETHDDSASAASVADVWLMLVQTSQFVPAPRDRGYKYEIYTTLLRLERIAPDRIDFRRIGLAKAKSWGVKWHDAGQIEVIRLF